VAVAAAFPFLDLAPSGAGLSALLFPSQDSYFVLLLSGALLLRPVPADARRDMGPMLALDRPASVAGLAALLVACWEGGERCWPFRSAAEDAGLQVWDAAPRHLNGRHDRGNALLGDVATGEHDQRAGVARLPAVPQSGAQAHKDRRRAA
jgi:hypothetical protein